MFPRLINHSSRDLNCCDSTYNQTWAQSQRHNIFLVCHPECHPEEPAFQKTCARNPMKYLAGKASFTEQNFKTQINVTANMSGGYSVIKPRQEGMEGSNRTRLPWNGPSSRYLRDGRSRHLITATKGKVRNYIIQS